MNGQQLSRLTLNGQRIANEETLVQQMGRIRDIRQGPDGFIYLVTDDRDGKPHAHLPPGTVQRTAGSYNVVTARDWAHGWRRARAAFCFMIQRTCLCTRIADRCA